MPIYSEGPHTFAIAGVSGEFRSVAIESAFLNTHLTKAQAQLRVTLLFCSFFYLAFSLTDIAVLGYSHAAFVLLLARLAVAGSAAGCCLLTYCRPQSVAMTRLAATVAEVVGMAAFMLVVKYRPDEVPWHAMSMALMLIVVYIYIPNRLAYSVAVALVSTIVFIFLVLEIGRMRPSDTLTMAMLLLLANTFGCIAARRYHRLWREEFQVQSILKNISVRDSLTGCFNRRYLQEKLLNTEIARAQRFGLCLTVIMCDLDHFKRVNDTYGHRVGDLVLMDFVRLLTTMTRDQVDSVVRYGGEEFLLVLPGTDLGGGVLLAERLRSTFEATATSHEAGQEISTTASFGVATIDFASMGQSISFDRLITTADELLYEAKNHGRNQVKALQLV